jgi:xanthine dehydrogenase YagS FAD-binding subunit
MSEFQAGGTDVQDRRRRGTSRGPIVPLCPAAVPDEVRWANGCASIGGLVRLAAVAADPVLAAAYPGLSAAAGGLATPQIRAVATVGGALLQRSRCWYFRDPAVSCFKKGGHACPARIGDHTFGVLFDLGPCVWPHPSTMGAACLAYDARVTRTSGAPLSISDLFGDGTDPTCDSHLSNGQVLLSVDLPPPVTGEQAAYHRVIGRRFAEWPLVEAVVRLVVSDGRIDRARIALGGVAPVPLCLEEAARALEGASAAPDAIRRVVERHLPSHPTLQATRYKRDLIPVAVADTAALALASPAASPDAVVLPGALPWRSP